MFVSIAAYKFAALGDLRALQEQLRRQTQGLRGTILLSTEGINIVVGGESEKVDALICELRAIAGLHDLEIKQSVANDWPFTRMLVKIKKEIIAFGVEGIDPVNHPSPRISPRTLKQWLDEGRPVTLLDTRNDYEVELGTFANAIALGTSQFREFPKAVEALPLDMKERTVVTFCTGGIRCEKAAPYLERAGFKNVFQLDGGILKYFEECAGAHYQGDCFVFDKRVSLDPHLRPATAVLCFNCLMPVSAEAQEHPHYVRDESCPRCFEEQ